jgi:hypothetical protein
MPRPASITPELLAEIASRRRAGEPWKVITADFRRRGLPTSRTRLWMVWRDMRDVHERRDDCDAAADGATP